MVHPGCSEKASIQDSLSEERQHRYSQVVVASHRTREQAGDLHERQESCFDSEQLPSGSETNDWRMGDTGTSDNDDWLQLAQISGLSPIPSGTHLEVDTALLRLARPPLIDSEDLAREQHLVHLDRQRRVLAGLLATALVSGTVLYGMVLRPEADRQAAAIAQLRQVNAEQRSAHERERASLTSRIGQLNARFSAIQFPIEANQKQSAQRQADSTVSSTQQSPPLRLPGSDPAPQVTALNQDAPQSAANEGAPVSAPIATAELAVPSEPPNEAAAADTPSEAPKPLDLQEAMKSAVAKEAKVPAKPVEAPASASKGCEQNDPLCGDLS